MTRALDVRPVTSAIGAEIRGVDLKAPLGAETARALNRAFLDHQVLFFRDQFLDAAELKAVLAHFGDLHETRWSRKGDNVADPYSHVVGSGEEPEEGSFTWRPHIDNASSRIPVKAIGLCAIDVPEVGADTMWVSLTAAYDALSEPLKVFLTGLTGLFSGVRREQLDRMILDGPAAWEGFKMRSPVAEQPLVHTHPETGRRALFVDSLWTWSIKDLHAEESAAVLAFLSAHCSRPEFQVRFKWRKGSLAIWDNRSTLHFKVRDGYAGDRHLQRASVDDTRRPAL